jgi:hypothetical protein
MSDTPEPLILDFLEWIAAGPRRRREVMEDWRSSCPRLTVREDSLDRGYVARSESAGTGQMIVLTPSGSRFLGANGRPAGRPELRHRGTDAGARA